MDKDQKQYLKEWRSKNPDYMKEWRAKNKERLDAEDKARKKTDEYRESKKEWDRKYFETKIKADPVKYEEAKRKQREWDLAHPEAHMERCKRHREAHREEIAATAKAKYQAMSEEDRKALHAKRSAYQKAYRLANKTKIVDQQREYRLRDPDHHEKLKAQARLRYRDNKLEYINRARRRLGFLTGTYTDSDLATMYETQKGICPGCQKDLEGKFEIDHIMPLSRDPAGDVLENIQLLCRPCNRRKYNKTPDQWKAIVEKRLLTYAASA